MFVIFSNKITVFWKGTHCTLVDKLAAR